MRCDFRQEHECSCPPSECRVQEREYPPVITASVRDILIVSAFVGFVAAVIFAVGARMEPDFKRQALDCQESCVNVVRR